MGSQVWYRHSDQLLHCTELDSTPSGSRCSDGGVSIPTSRPVSNSTGTDSLAEKCGCPSLTDTPDIDHSVDEPEQSVPSSISDSQEASEEASAPVTTAVETATFLHLCLTVKKKPSTILTNLMQLQTQPSLSHCYTQEAVRHLIGDTRFTQHKVYSRMSL